MTPIPKWHANRTPIEIEEKVLHLGSKYHLGPMRIVWYLARYHDIKISDATVSRILKRDGVDRLPRGTRLRKVHTKRYNKRVPGHHIQMDVKFLTFQGENGKKVRRFQFRPIDYAMRTVPSLSGPDFDPALIARKLYGRHKHGKITSVNCYYAQHRCYALQFGSGRR